MHDRGRGRRQERRRAAQDGVAELCSDILASGRFEKAQSVPHHDKHYDIAQHSIEVAEAAYAIAQWLNRHGADIDAKQATRAALLHDIGMTEDAVFGSPSRVKAYTHPEEGARIARAEFGADDEQADAILRHMWPIGHVPPRHASGWVVLVADKWASLAEVAKEAERRTSALCDCVRRRRR